MKRTISGRPRASHKRVHRAAFVLSDDYHNLTIANVLMSVKLTEQKFDQNIWQGEIASAWEKLPDKLKLLQVVGVLYADRTKLYEGRIGWLEESGTANSIVNVDDLQQAFALKAMEKVK
jgi:hypothetical protein